MMNIMVPCRVVKILNSHSITSNMAPSPTTRNPRTHPIPRMGRSTMEEWTSVLCMYVSVLVMKQRRKNIAGISLPEQASVFLVGACSLDEFDHDYEHDHQIDLCIRRLWS